MALGGDPLAVLYQRRQKRVSRGEQAGPGARSARIADEVGEGGRVRVEAASVPYCRSFAGEAIVGRDVPPFHPHCSCVAVVT